MDVEAVQHLEPAGVNESGWLLIELAPVVVRLQNEMLARLEEPLTHRQYRTLRRVQQGFDSPSGLQRLMLLKMPTISESIGALVTRGLLERLPDRSDGRRVRLSVTARGADALAVADQTLADLSQRLLERFETGDQERLGSALRQLLERTRYIRQVEHTDRSAEGRNEDFPDANPLDSSR